MMSGMPLETCWAFNKCWNNKFYYNVASCWLFLLNHTAMHGSMNIKLIFQFLIFDVFYMFRTRRVHLQEDGCMYRYILLILMHVKNTIPYQYIEPSSWRWTPRFRNMYKTSKFKSQNINLENVHFFGLYCTIILQCTVQKNTESILILYVWFSQVVSFHSGFSTKPLPSSLFPFRIFHQTPPK